MISEHDQIVADALRVADERRMNRFIFYSCYAEERMTEESRAEVLSRIYENLPSKYELKIDIKKGGRVMDSELWDILSPVYPTMLLKSEPPVLLDVARSRAFEHGVINGTALAARMRIEADSPSYRVGLLIAEKREDAAEYLMKKGEERFADELRTLRADHTEKLVRMAAEMQAEQSLETERTSLADVFDKADADRRRVFEDSKRRYQGIA